MEVPGMKAPRRGFTLIELLVVIAIISILASILFPVFARARAKGRQTACLSNVRQVAMAFIMYANDADEQMPYGGPTAGNPGVPLWIDSIFAYTHNDQIIICPDRKDASPGYGINFMASGMAEGSFFDPASKILLGDVNPEFLGVTAPGVKPTKWWINDPGNTFCAAPSDTSFTANRFPQRHNDGIIYGYVDGHAKWGREEQMAQQVFWNPATRTR
jgi:prepilin-type N-terminal cleavage/methylation domain-containing protein/prepilin-type processing-associated H-X9-DG protein